MKGFVCKDGKRPFFVVILQPVRERVFHVFRPLLTVSEEADFADSLRLFQETVFLYGKTDDAKHNEPSFGRDIACYWVGTVFSDVV